MKGTEHSTKLVTKVITYVISPPTSFGYRNSRILLALHPLLIYYYRNRTAVTFLCILQLSFSGRLAR